MLAIRHISFYPLLKGQGAAEIVYKKHLRQNIQPIISRRQGVPPCYGRSTIDYTISTTVSPENIFIRPPLHITGEPGNVSSPVLPKVTKIYVWSKTALTKSVYIITPCLAKPSAIALQFSASVVKSCVSNRFIISPSRLGYFPRCLILCFKCWINPS